LIASLRNGELMIEECGAHAGSKPQESRTRQDLVAQMLWAGFVEGILELRDHEQAQGKLGH
jgi:hypothetical protein